MMGMEKMIAGMIGLTPEQMQQIANGLFQSATDGAESLKRIEIKLDAILERLEHGDGNNAS